MKKFLYFAFMAMLAMPLMVSCKGINTPDKPDPEQQDTLPTPQEQYEDWMGSADSLQVPVNEDAFVGIWRQAFQSERFKDSVNANGWQINDFKEPIPGVYYDIRKDHTVIIYYFDVREGVALVDTVHATWKLKDSKTIRLQESWSPDPSDYTIEYVEADRFVWYLLLPRDGDIPARLWYYGYERVNALPELPKNPSARLEQNAWKVISDTVWVYEVKTVEVGPNEYQSERTLKEKRVNKTVTGGTFTFKEDGMFYITNDKGEKIGIYEWKDEENSENSTYRNIRISPLKNELNLQSWWINFYPNLKDPTRGNFQMQFYDEEDLSKFYEYLFIVEAVEN